MLRGKKIVITSGPTRASLDAVRFLSNVSSGRFGVLLAEEALKKGADVTFIYGKGSLTPAPHQKLKLISVVTNDDLAITLKRRLTKSRCDAVIHAMAVLDFQPEKLKKGKTKTKRGEWILKLVPTRKIILSIKKWSPKTFLVGFKLEVGVSQQELLRRARALLKKSGADLVLANQLRAGGDQTHQGWLLDKKGELVGQARGKKNLARIIVRELEKSIASHPIPKRIAP